MLSTSTETASWRPWRSRIAPRRGSRLIVRSLWRAACTSYFCTSSTWSCTRRTTTMPAHRHAASASSISRSRTLRWYGVGISGSCRGRRVTLVGLRRGRGRRDARAGGEARPRGQRRRALDHDQALRRGGTQPEVAHRDLLHALQVLEAGLLEAELAVRL